MWRGLWYIKWKKQATKKNIENSLTFFVYICIGKMTKIRDSVNVRVILSGQITMFSVFSFFADQHFLQWPNGNYILWGEEIFLNLAASNMFKDFIFSCLFFFLNQGEEGDRPLFRALNKKRLWRLSFSWLLLYYYFADFITENYSASSVAEQLSLTTSNCKTLRE